MDDMWILGIIFSAQALIFILAMAHLNWQQAKMRKERELREFIAQSLEEWPVEQALIEWLNAALVNWPVERTLEDWLKTSLDKWPANEVLRKQIREVVEVEVRRQLLDANLKAA